MVAKQSKRMNVSQIPKAIGIGTVVSVAITIFCSAIGALLITMEKIGEGSTAYLQVVTLLLSSSVGALLAVTIAKQKRLPVSLSLGAAYFASLLAITALFFQGQYSGVGETALIILAGVTTVALLGLKSNKKPKKRAIH